MENQQDKRWGTFKAKSRVFADAYFGPWVVRALSFVVALYLGLEILEGFVSVIGIPYIETKDWFPITQHVPHGVAPWALAAIFFLMSLAIAQHVSNRMAVLEAIKGRDLSELRLVIKSLEMDLAAERARLELRAIQGNPTEELKDELKRLREERASLEPVS